MRGRRMVASLMIFNLVVIAAVIALLVWSGSSLAQPETPAVGSSLLGSWGVMAAAIAVGMGSLGAAVAVAAVGSAAMGALSEKPELGGRALIFLGLAEGIAIYGLIVAVMILAKF
jgi:V/A-type H+/Na+-transporting ATPase subunit K